MISLKLERFGPSPRDAWRRVIVHPRCILCRHSNRGLTSASLAGLMFAKKLVDDLCAGVVLHLDVCRSQNIPSFSMTFVSMVFSNTLKKFSNKKSTHQIRICSKPNFQGRARRSQSPTEAVSEQSTLHRAQAHALFVVLLKNLQGELAELLFLAEFREDFWVTFFFNFGHPGWSFVEFWYEKTCWEWYGRCEAIRELWCCWKSWF